MEFQLVKKDGAVSTERPFDFYCSQLRNGTYTVTIKRKSEPRTLSQNALMWLWLKCLEDATGQPAEDWHEYFKTKFNPKLVGVNGKVYRIGSSTARLSTTQMSDYMSKIQAEAAAEYGIVLPLPSDRYYQDFVERYK